MELDPKNPAPYFDSRVAATIVFCASFVAAVVEGLAFVAALVVGAVISVLVYAWMKLTRRIWPDR